MTASIYTSGYIEPAVNNFRVNEQVDAILSIAISLKRIADRLDTSEAVQFNCMSELVMAIKDSR